MKRTYVAITILILGCGIGRALWVRKASAPVKIPESFTEHKMKVNGMERVYMVNSGMNPPAGAPLIIVLHGGTQGMRKLFSKDAGGTRTWLDIAKREHLWLIAPNGTDAKTGDSLGNRQNWNDLREPESSKTNKVNDVKFIKELISEAILKYKINPKKVYVTGASNGGMMTMRLLLEESQLFAAGGAVVASLPKSNDKIVIPKTPTPLIMINGTSDPLVLWNGGQVAKNRGETRSVLNTIDFWAKANRIDKSRIKKEPIKDISPQDGCTAIRYIGTPGPGGAPLQWIIVRGGGHNLASIKYDIPNTMIIRKIIGPVCKDFEAAEIIWDFFKTSTR